MHVSIRLHLVHAVVAALGKAVAVLVSVRRTLLRLSIQWLTVAVERWGGLLRGGRLKTRDLSVDGRGVRCVGARTSAGY